MKKWLDKYNDDVPQAQVGRMLAPITGDDVAKFFDMFSVPQKAVTKMVTGKYQTPSEAMNIKNPVGAFATDMILDPVNLLGIGAATKAPKATKAAVKAVGPELSDLRYVTKRKPYQFDASKIENLSAKQQKQISESVGKSMDAIRDNAEKEAYKRHGSYRKDRSTGNLNPVLRDNMYMDMMMNLPDVNLVRRNENGGQIPQAENGIEGTMGGLTDVGFNYNGAWGGTMQMGGGIPGAVGFTYARVAGAAPANGPYAKKTKASAQDGRAVSDNTRLKPIIIDKPINRETVRSTNKSYVMSPQEALLNKFKGVKLKESQDRLNKTAEKITAVGSLSPNPLIRIPSAAANFTLGAMNSPTPTDRGLDYMGLFGSTPSSLNSFKQIGRRAPFFKGITALDALSDIFEFTPSEDLPKKQNGGEMKFYQEGLDWKPRNISRNGSEIPVDPMGYWNPDNVGEPVIIPSNEITMEGVYQPLLGISDTGDTQMMYPGEDYEFDGESVTEYPMAQKGKTVPTYVEKFGLNENDLKRAFATKPINNKGDVYYDIDKSGKKFRIHTQSGGLDYIEEISNTLPTVNIKKEPIYVDNPNDPRLRAYNDSLNLYNSYKNVKKAYEDRGYETHYPASERWVNVMNEELKKPLPNKIAGYKNDDETFYVREINPSGGGYYANTKIPMQLYNPNIRPKGMQIAQSTREEDSWDKKSEKSIPKHILIDKNKIKKSIKEKSNEGFFKSLVSGNATDALPFWDYSNVEPKQEVILNPPVPKKPKPQPLKKKSTPQPTPQPIQEQPVKTVEQPKPVERKQNVYEGTPVYSATVGSGGPSALVGFANQKGDTTFIKPEDYERFGVPKYGKEFIQNRKKQRNGGVNNADAQPIEKLDQLLNFTNYNKPTKGGWLDKYQ